MFCKFIHFVDVKHFSDMEGKLDIFKLGMMYSKNSNSTNGELVYPGIQSGGSRFLLMSLCPDQKSSQCCDSDRSHWLVGIPRVSLDLLQRPN